MNCVPGELAAGQEERQVGPRDCDPFQDVPGDPDDGAGQLSSGSE